MKLVPKCLRSALSKNRMPAAYTADGYMLPCCHMDDPVPEPMIRKFGLRDDDLKLENNDSVKDIIASDRWNNFFDILLNNPKEAPSKCWKKCGEIDCKDKLVDSYLKESYADSPNLDISYRCELKCPLCVRQKSAGITMIKRSSDITMENLNKILDHYKTRVTFCGQISDPIYHPNFLEILKTAVDRCDLVRVSTTASHKPKEFWEEAFKYGVGDVQWVFGIDGIDKKSEIYRIGSDFEDAWNVMLRANELGHYTTWQYIIFDYNEDDINEAILLAHEYDLNLLVIKSQRAFNPRATYRKNVEDTIPKRASDKNRQKRNKTQEHVVVNRKRKLWDRKHNLIVKKALE